MSAKSVWSGKVSANNPAGIKTGIILKKDSLYSFLAKGWTKYSSQPHAWTAPQGVLPEGPGEKYKDGVTLQARVGDDAKAYEIGNGKYAWPAPADGELTFFIFDSNYDDNSGEFEIEVYETPDAELKRVWSGEVPANKAEGASTGLQVKTGDVVTIKASGWIKYGKEEFALATPFGRVRTGLETRDEVVLKARIGDKSYDIGAGVVAWRIPADGELSLYVHDSVKGYGDNSGSFKAEVYK